MDDILDHYDFEYAKYRLVTLSKKVKEVIDGKTAQKITQISILPVEEEKQEQLSICEGCTTGNASKHTGKYVRIMDWALEETNRFVDILSQ